MIFEWHIQRIIRSKDNDFITQIHWLRSCQSETNFANSIGILTYDQNQYSNSLIPFEEITKEQVIQWLENELDVESIDNNLSERVNELDQYISEIPWSEEISTDGE